MEQKRPADIIQELLDYLWNGLGLEEKGWKRLKKGDFKKKMKNGLTYQIWFDRSRYNYIDYEIGHGNVEVGFSLSLIHISQMEDSLNLVFDEISFELGFNGEKHELILTPEGDKVKLFELVYFQKHAPKEVLLSLIHISVLSC